MILKWEDFVGMLGCSKADAKFIRLPQEFNELPSFDEGILGDRNYYSFFQSGIMLLLENDEVDQISFYIEPAEGFSQYQGDLPMPPNATEAEVMQLWGTPSSFGGEKMDMLLGYINRWIKYDKGNYSLHLQFNKDDKLCRATLMK